MARQYRLMSADGHPKCRPALGAPGAGEIPRPRAAHGALPDGDAQLTRASRCSKPIFDLRPAAPRVPGSPSASRSPMPPAPARPSSASEQGEDGPTPRSVPGDGRGPGVLAQHQS
jgi:hypothetical protein